MPKKKRPLGKALQKAASVKAPTEPLWKGPESDSAQGGVTQSLLQKFLVCRERFRLQVVEGWKPVDTFNHRIEYGNMWHECEEALGLGAHWTAALLCYTKKLCKKYRTQQEQINHWYNVCKVQFPIYLYYWKDHKEKGKTPLMAEQTFRVPYSLPNGRVVYLRGKWDGMELLADKRVGGLYLREHKTKGDIDEELITKQLGFDVQTMFYGVSFQEAFEDYKKYSSSCHSDFSRGARPGEGGWNGFPDGIPVFNHLRGISYNVVRRPLSGGKGSIRPHKATSKNPAETMEAFYGRLGEVIEAEPESFFVRWDVLLTKKDLLNFRERFLDPILEQLCDWWDWIEYCHSKKLDLSPSKWCGHSKAGIHWQTPYGVYNPLSDGKGSELDLYLSSGSTLGLERSKNLFPEL